MKNGRALKNNQGKQTAAYRKGLKHRNIKKYMV